MPLATGDNRFQIDMLCLDQLVAPQAEVRLIDAFIHAFNLDEFRFIQKGKSKEGRPAISNADLLKLYLYGYLNRTRSSRRLHRLCKVNIEVQWLIHRLKPCHTTINSFRKDNNRSLIKVFRAFNRFLRGQGLYDEDTVAIDGSKFRAQNSKKNNYNEKKVKDHLKHIDKKIDEYLQLLDQNDEMHQDDHHDETLIDVAQKLDELAKRQTKYKDLNEQIQEAHKEGITQVSTTDPDARALPRKMNIIEVSYNVVTTAEAKNKLITNFEVHNQNDTYALSMAARKAKRALGKKADQSIKALADKGFDTGLELKKCSQHKIETYVAVKNRANKLKNKAFNKNQFIYDHEQDAYICPKGESLKSNGTLYKKNNGKLRQAFHVKHYKLPYAICAACEHRMECAGPANLSNSKGRYIERNEYEDYIEENKERVQQYKELYRKRQQIIEHPFGTIKRQWGYDHTLVKGRKKVAGEFALIFTAYNLRRAISILGFKTLLEKLGEAASLFKIEYRRYFKAFSDNFDSWGIRGGKIIAA